VTSRKAPRGDDIELGSERFLMSPLKVTEMCTSYDSVLHSRALTRKALRS